MEATEYRLTRETWFVGRRLEVVAVAGLLWTSWWVWGDAGFVFFAPFSFGRTRPVSSMRPPCFYIRVSGVLFHNINWIRPGFRWNLFSSNITFAPCSFRVVKRNLAGSFFIAIRTNDVVVVYILFFLGRDVQISFFRSFRRLSHQLALGTKIYQRKVLLILGSRSFDDIFVPQFETNQGGRL